jgi:eukaryotic-like serine/threonine-protein kinase
VVVRPASPPIPKLTAAAPQLEVHADDGATLLVDGNEYLHGAPPAPPPRAPPGLSPEPVTDPALEAPRPVITAAPAEPASRPSGSAETFVPPRPAAEESSSPPVLRPTFEPAPGGEPPPGSEPDALPAPAEEPALFAAAGWRAPGTRRLWALGAGILVVLGVLGVVALGDPPQGMLLLELSPPELHARARVNVNGNDLGSPPSWPLLQRVPAGKVVVMVTADGFKPSVGTVTVARGSEATPFTVALQRNVGTARVVVLPDPDDAEVRVDGQVVKRGGAHGFWAGEVSVGSDHQVEVRRSGFRPYTSSVLARSTEDGLQVRAVLEPFEFAVRVTSQPPGAAVFSGERQLGVTPLSGRVPATASALTFRKRCFETAQVPLRLPEQPGPAVPVRVVLRRAPNCR